MHIWIIYKTTCLANGKIYVGQHKTTVIEDGYLGSGKLIRRAIKKHDIDQFEREILAECTCREDANAQEEFWIKELDSTNIEIGYNITSHAWGGQPMTEETREKLSKARKGIPRSEEFKAKLRGKKKPPVSEETRKKRSESAKGRIWYNNPETGESSQLKEDMPVPAGWVRGRGKMKKREQREFSKEALDNIKKANQCEEKRKKISDTLTGHHVSEETRAKISNTLKGENHEKASDAPDN